MSLNFEVNSSQIIFAYDRNINIRKRQFEFEDLLQSNFRIPFTTIPVSDQQDGNIPRFESRSLNGHSKIEVTQFRTTLTSNFSSDYRNNIEKISNYLRDRSALIKTLISNEQNQFGALIIELVFLFDNEENVNNSLRNEVGAKLLNQTFKDFSFAYSKVFNEIFYLNIKCSKFIGNITYTEDGVLIPSNFEKVGISVIIDINTKVQYDNNQLFDFKLINDLEVKIFELIKNNQLENYLNGNII